MYETEVISVDRAALPQAMLPMFKTHCRVSYTDDDQYLSLCLVRAIDLCERHWGSFVFGTVVLWTTSYRAQRRELPVAPVQSFTASDEAGNDVTSDYRIKGEYLERVDGQPVPAGLSVTLHCGYDAYVDMPPSAIDVSFRIGGHLFENREAVTSYSLDQVPQWMNDLLVGTWIPRA